MNRNRTRQYVMAFRFCLGLLSILTEQIYYRLGKYRQAEADLKRAKALIKYEFPHVDKLLHCLEEERQNSVRAQWDDSGAEERRLYC